MEVPRLGEELELELLAYTTATATSNPSHICKLHHSSWQWRSLTHWARPEIKPKSSWILVWSLTRWATTGTPILVCYETNFALKINKFSLLAGYPAEENNSSLRLHIAWLDNMNARQMSPMAVKDWNVHGAATQGLEKNEEKMRKSQALSGWKGGKLTRGVGMYWDCLSTTCW